MMDIFRVRRRLLGRKLWKCRCRGIPADVDKQAMCAVVKLLTYYQLKALDRAVKLRFSTAQNVCVPVDMTSFDASISPTAFVALCCRLWRTGWPRHCTSDVTSALKPLPLCSCLSKRQDVICCNPYHWTIDVTPPSTSVWTDDNSKVAECFDDDRIKRQINAAAAVDQNGSSCHSDSDDNNNCTRTADDAGEVGGPWCRVAYRQYRDYVGSRQPGSLAVHAEHLHVFAGLNDGTAGLCLSALRATAASSPQQCRTCCRTRTSTSQNDEQQIDKTLTRIGHGVVISRRPQTCGRSDDNVDNEPCNDDDGVWLYNCSDSPVFVDSRSIRTVSGGVCKLLPGRSVCVYDRRLVDRARAAAAGAGAGMKRDSWKTVVDAAAEHYDSVLISFVKGWGGDYKRQTVLACPCWLEVVIDEMRLVR